MNLADLRKPFPADRISWRVGSTTKDKSKGMALAYIDARDVQDRLDEVCGVNGWQCRYPHANGKTVCEIGIWCEFPGYAGQNHPSEWVWKSDGAGDSDIEAEKGALSDAFKRAAVRWGVGRYLYDLDSPWVELDGNKIKASEYARLRKMLDKDAPAPASEMQPNVSASKPKTTPGDWALKAEREVMGLHSREEMAEWMKKNGASVDRLREVDKPIWDALNLKIAMRNDELELIAA